MASLAARRPAGKARLGAFSVETTDRLLMARSLVYVYAAGGTLILLSILTLPDVAKAETALAATGAYGVALLLIAFDKLPAWALQICLALGSVLVEFVVYANKGSATVYTVFYFWIAIYACYFFTPAQAAAQILFIFVSYGLVIGLLDDPGSPEAISWMLTTAALVVAGAMIGLLKHRIDGVLADAKDSARTDELTGLRNRRAFEELAHEELERAERVNEQFSLIILDVDHFKSLNDSYGHQEGDRALQRVSDCLEDSRRLRDSVSRIGGEEFAVVMPDTNVREGYLCAERIRRKVAETCANEPGQITISLGVATFPFHGNELHDLMRAADQALYVAKETGRNRSVMFNTNAVDTVSAALQHRGTSDEKHLSTVLALAEVLDIRDAGTAAHSQTVGYYAEAIAHELNLPEERCSRLRFAGMVHDIGKIGVPDAVLRKPDPLDPAEMGEIKKHPEVGARILAGTDLEDISAWVLAHHERPDGKGYPFGLAGDQIPLEGRILAVADAWEAMTSGRVYQPALSPEQARAELKRWAGQQFDEQVVEAFLRADLTPPERPVEAAPDAADAAAAETGAVQPDEGVPA